MGPSARLVILGLLTAAVAGCSEADEDSTGGTVTDGSTGVQGDDDDGQSGSGGSTSSAGNSTSGSSSSSSGDDDDDNAAATADPSDPSGETGEAESAAGTTGDVAETEGATSDSAGETNGDSGDGTIDVTLQGCSVDFGGEVVASYNGSLGVASIYDEGGTLSGSFQFDLDGPDTFTLSTQHRVDTGTVINMVDPGQGTWTNIDNDALTGGVDSIGGVLDVSVWDPANGMAVIELTGVSLQNVVDQSVCTIDGSIEVTSLLGG